MLQILQYIKKHPEHAYPRKLSHEFSQKPRGLDQLVLHLDDDDDLAIRIHEHASRRRGQMARSVAASRTARLRRFISTYSEWAWQINSARLRTSHRGTRWSSKKKRLPLSQRSSSLPAPLISLRVREVMAGLASGRICSAIWVTYPSGNV